MVQNTRHKYEFSHIRKLYPVVTGRHTCYLRLAVKYSINLCANELWGCLYFWFQRIPKQKYVSISFPADTVSSSPRLLSDSKPLPPAAFLMSAMLSEQRPSRLEVSFTARWYVPGDVFFFADSRIYYFLAHFERIPVTKPPKLRGDLRADTGDLKLATYYCSPTQ